MTEKCKSAIDKEASFDSQLTYQRRLNYLPHILLLAKLLVNGFSTAANLISLNTGTYLSDK